MGSGMTQGCISLDSGQRTGPVVADNTLEPRGWLPLGGGAGWWCWWNWGG